MDILTDRILADMNAGVRVTDDIVILGLRFAPRPSPRLSLVIPADPAELGGMRAAIRDWTQLEAVGAVATRNLLVAVGEAVANSMEHAYRNRPTGTVELDVCRTAAALVVQVRDHGVWSPPSADTDSRGRGTDVMATLTTGYVRHTGRRGTTVHFSVPTEGQAAHD